MSSNLMNWEMGSPFTPQQDVALFDLSRRRAFGEYDLGHEQVRLVGEGLPHLRLALGAQAQPPTLVEGLEEELALDVAARYWLPCLEAPQCSERAVQGQEVVGRRPVGSAAGLERHHIPVDVNNGTSGAPTASGGAGLVVARVEVGIPVRVLRRVAI